MKSIPLLESQVIRAALLALVGLVGLILSFFGISEDVFGEKATKLVDALLLVITTGSVLWAAYARATKPTPPITDTAVVATAARDLKISQGGFVRLRYLSGVLLLAVSCAALTLPACTGTRAAFKAAQHTSSADAVEATAYVVTEQYAATVTEAAALKNAGTLTGAKLEAVRKADDTVRPLITGLPGKPGVVQAVESYRAVKSAKTTADLQAAVDAAVVKLSDFLKAVRAGKVLR